MLGTITIGVRGRVNKKTKDFIRHGQGSSNSFSKTQVLQTFRVRCWSVFSGRGGQALKNTFQRVRMTQEQPSTSLPFSPTEESGWSCSSTIQGGHPSADSKAPQSNVQVLASPQPGLGTAS